MRVLLAVVVTVAILAVALPAVDHAGRERTARSVGSDLRELGAAAASLADGEAAVAPGRRGAHRAVTVDLPRESLTSAGVASVAVGGLPAGTDGDVAARDDRRSDVLVARLTGGDRVVVPVETDLRAGRASAPDDRALVVRDPGEHRLHLRLVVRGDRHVVVVQRQRGFMSEAAAKPGHVAGPGATSRPARGLPV